MPFPESCRFRYCLESHMPGIGQHAQIIPYKCQILSVCCVVTVVMEVLYCYHCYGGAVLLPLSLRCCVVTVVMEAL